MRSKKWIATASSRILLIASLALFCQLGFAREPRPLLNLGGKVFDSSNQPMPGIQLQLYRIERESKMPEATPYLISPATSSDGRFSFDRLKPANYEVQAVDASGVFFGPPKRIRLAESQEIEIKTILTEKFKVSGQVESVSSDLNLGGIVVICTDPNTYQSKETKTGPDGRFEFSGLREGAYLITLQVPALESVPIAQHIQIQKQNVELHRFKVAPLKNQDVISLLPTP